MDTKNKAILIDWTPLGTGNGLISAEEFKKKWMSEEQGDLVFVEQWKIGKGIMAQIKESQYPELDMGELRKRVSDSYRDAHREENRPFMWKSQYDALDRRLRFERIYSEAYTSIMMQTQELLYDIEVIQLTMEYMTGERVDID